MRTKCSLIVEGATLVLHGGEGSGMSNGVHCLDLEQTVQGWSSQTPAPDLGIPAASSHSATVVGREMVVFGGEELVSDARGQRFRCLLNKLSTFNLDEQKWIALPTLGVPPTFAVPMPRKGHSATALPQNRMLVLGGAGKAGGATGPQHYWSDAFVLDCTTWLWTKLRLFGAVPGKRGGHTAALKAGTSEVFIYGGLTDPVRCTPDGTPLPLSACSERTLHPALVTVLDTESGRCSPFLTVGAHPGPLHDHAAVFDIRSPTLMYLFGGRRHDGTVNGDFYILDTEAAAWTCVSRHSVRPSSPPAAGWSWTPPSPRFSSAVAALDGGFVVFGGSSSTGMCDASVFVLSTPAMAVDPMRGAAAPRHSCIDTRDLLHDRAKQRLTTTQASGDAPASTQASLAVVSPTRERAAPEPAASLTQRRPRTERRDMWLYQHQHMDVWRLALQIPTTAFHIANGRRNRRVGAQRSGPTGRAAGASRPQSPWTLARQRREEAEAAAALRESAASSRPCNPEGRPYSRLGEGLAPQFQVEIEPALFTYPGRQSRAPTPAGEPEWGDSSCSGWLPPSSPCLSSAALESSHHGTKVLGKPGKWGAQERSLAPAKPGIYAGTKSFALLSRELGTALKAASHPRKADQHDAVEAVRPPPTTLPPSPLRRSAGAWLSLRVPGQHPSPGL